MRHILCLLLFVFGAAVAPAQMNEVAGEFTQATSTENTQIICLPGTFRYHVVEIETGGGAAATTCTFNIQGARRRDGVYGIISDRDGNNLECTSDVLLFITDTPVSCLKLQVATFSGGTDPTLDVGFTSVK